MSTSPRYIGDVRPVVCTFATDSNSYSVGGTASNLFSLHFVDMSNGAAYTGSGTWSNISGNSAQYTPNAGDRIVTTAGIYRWWPQVNGIDFDPQVVEVLDPSQINV